MKRTFLIIPLLLGFFAFIIACKSDKAYPQYGGYPGEIGEIMINKCATSGCHNDASYLAAAGLNLSTWENLFKGSNSGASVIPFNSSFSTLCYFINSYPNLGPINQPLMPLGGSALSYDEVQKIKTWIDNGAPDVNGNIKWTTSYSKQKAYVVNQGCDVVTVFDCETQLPIRYISVGNKPGISESPHMVKVSPDGQYWYVVFIGNNILQKYRTSDDTFVEEVDLGNYQNWNTLVISDNGKRGYCVSWQSAGRVASIDLENMALLQNLGGFTEPHGVALNGTNDTLYITAQKGNCIYKVDTAFNSLDYVSLEVGVPYNLSSGSLEPHEIMFSPDGSKYFVTCQKTNEVRVVKTNTDQVFQIIPTGVYPQEMAISTVKQKLYVTCTYDSISINKAHGVVTQIDLNSYSRQMIGVGFLPHGIAVDDIYGYVYVASRNILSNGPAPHHTGVCDGRNGFINYINLNTFQVTNKKTEIASDPYSISIKK